MGVSKTMRRVFAFDWFAKAELRFAFLSAFHVLRVATVRKNIFPYPQVISAVNDVKTALRFRPDRLKWRYYRYQEATESQTVSQAPDQMLHNACCKKFDWSFFDGVRDACTQ